MKAQFGFIGRDEINLAKEKLVNSYRLDNGSWINKNLWFEKPHTGNYVKGFPYDDIEELLEGKECVLDVFENLQSIDEYIEEFDYSFSDEDLIEIKEIISSGKTAYMLDDEISDDKSFLIFNRIEDGQYMWTGTVEEAYNELNGWNGWNDTKVNTGTELLAVGLLK